MIEQLFGSKTRVKLLNLFYSNPNRAFYVREITRKIDEQINSVRRELANLLNIGIIKSENTNNRVYYEVNQEYEYFRPLQEIFGQSSATINKKDNINQEDQPLLDSLKMIGNIKLAVLTGQFTRDSSVDIDFLIVGNVNHNALDKFINELEKAENKTIRYSVMSLEEFNYRKTVHDRFVVSVVNSKKQIIIDQDGILTIQENN
jgi:predicted transcriptional regulator